MKQQRALDVAIRVTLVLVVVVAAYLGYSMWSSQKQIEASSPGYRALNNIRVYVKRHPNNATARVDLAQALIAVGKPEEAIEQYKQALKLDPKNVPGRMGLGLLAMQQKQYKVAEGHWREIIALLVNGPDARDARLEQAYFYLGQCYVETRQYEDAVGALKQALYIRRDASDSHYTLAVAYRGLGITDMEKQELETALAFEPQMPEANYDLGKIFLKEGDKAAAAERFRLSADKAPEGVREPTEALAKLGSADDHVAAAQKLQSSDPKKALIEGRIALAIDPSRTDVAVLVAKLYASTGKAEQAKGLYEKVLKRDPNNQAAKDGIARLNRVK